MLPIEVLAGVPVWAAAGGATVEAGYKVDCSFRRSTSMVRWWTAVSKSDSVDYVGGVIDTLPPAVASGSGSNCKPRGGGGGNSGDASGEDLGVLGVPGYLARDGDTEQASGGTGGR